MGTMATERKMRKGVTGQEGGGEQKVVMGGERSAPPSRRRQERVPIEPVLGTAVETAAGGNGKA